MDFKEKVLEFTLGLETIVLKSVCIILFYLILSQKEKIIVEKTKPKLSHYTIQFFCVFIELAVLYYLQKMFSQKRLYFFDTAFISHVHLCLHSNLGTCVRTEEHEHNRI